MMSRSKVNPTDLLITVSVKVRAFWPDSGEAWFIQVKAQFVHKGVTVSSTKFYYCVSSFNQEAANQVLDLIKSPPSSEPYQAQKKQLLKLFKLDDFQRYEAISDLNLSGDMKQSKLMLNMLALLLAGHKPRFFCVGLFNRVACQRSSPPTQGRFLRSYFPRPESRQNLPKQSVLFCVRCFQRPRGLCQRRQILSF